MELANVRIGKRAYIVSTAVLFGICTLSVMARFYIRVGLQKELSIDDAFLAVAISCLICSIVIMYSVALDKLYQIGAMSASHSAIDFPIDDVHVDPGLLQPVYSFLKWNTVDQTLCWCSIVAVKFSFLFLFRRLIDRIPRLITYWWFVIAFNIIAGGYGFSTYFLICPYYDNPKIYQCSLPSGVKRLIGHEIAQTAMDIIGDLLILYIPVNLIWKIQIRWTQKVPLVLSLCLTGIIILVTVTRIACFKISNQVDLVWESYFLVVAAEIGVILASISTYRTLFVSRRKDTRHRGCPSSSTKERLKRVFLSSPWRSKARDSSTPINQRGDQYSHFDEEALPDIPRPCMTGIRTFINGRELRDDASDFMESQFVQDEHSNDDRPLRMESLA